MNKAALVDVKRRLSGLELAVIELLHKLCKNTARRSKTGARYCFAGQKWIAQTLGVSRETVSHVVTRLSRLGILEVIHRRKKDGFFQTNLYKVINCVNWWRYAVMDIWKRPGIHVNEPSHIEYPKKEITTKSEPEPDRPLIQGVLSDFIRELESKPPPFSFKS